MNLNGHDKQIQDLIASTGLFGNKIFRISDPDILGSLKGKVNPPYCGVIYEGISSDGKVMDDGGDSKLSVAVILVVDSKARDIRQCVEKDELMAIMTAVRDAIKGQIAPSGRPWNFVIEIPVPLDNAGMAYYQKWNTNVIV